MSEESFDVIISDQEYKQLKLHQHKNTELTLAVATLQAQVNNSEGRER